MLKVSEAEDGESRSSIFNSVSFLVPPGLAHFQEVFYAILYYPSFFYFILTPPGKTTECELLVFSIPLGDPIV